MATMAGSLAGELRRLRLLRRRYIMQNKMKLENIAILGEFLAGSGLGLFFHWVLHYKEASYVIFGVGVLLSLATYLIRGELALVREKLTSHYDQSHELTFALARIADADCQVKATELLATTKKTMALLQEGFVPLDETEFWLEAATAAEQASREIKAVDPITTGWDTKGVLLNYYRANVRALERGVRITRIFVIKREEIDEGELQKLLIAHSQDGIELKVAYRDELPSLNDTTWGGNCSFSFGVFDNRVVTDVFPNPGSYYGRKTSRGAEVAKYQRLFDLIEHVSHRLTMVEGRVVVEDGVNGVVA
jgi:hypothetical protein